MDGFLDSWTVEANDALVANDGDWYGCDVGVFAGVNFLISDAHTVEPVHEGVTIGTSGRSVNFDHDIISIAWK